MTDYELMVVMPVYNEEACICGVVDSWIDELTRQGINFKLIILNDGSRDATAEKLAMYCGNSRVEVITKENSGHGPTILCGYHLAVSRAKWVFQTDSDDEMRPAYFHRLWRERQHYPAIFGYRADRRQGCSRRLISAVSRQTVRFLFAPGVIDVNTPYRLMRSDLLTRIITEIPVDTFAPNILISGVFAASGVPVLNIPVPHEGRKSGTASIVRWRLFRAVCRSMLQTIDFSSRRVRVVGNA